MSFSTTITTKSHVRQEGFAPDDLFTANTNGFHAKYPSSPLNLPSMDFGDELAGLMAADASNNRSSPPNGYQQQHLHQDDHYRHNIFDTSSVSSTASVYPAFNGSQPSSMHSDFSSFNSTLPSLNSSMRYDPHPPPQHQPQRSRSGSGSASRLPVVASSSSNSSSTDTTGSIGPTRTSRSRRNGSISGTSPPPFGHGHGRPHAIVIPGNGRGGATAAGPSSWFVNGSQSSPHPTNQHQSLSPSIGGSSSHHHSHHPNSHSLSIPKSPVASNGGQVASPLSTTLPLGNSHSHSHSLSHGHQHHPSQQQQHSHHGHTPLSHSLSHSGALNGGLNSMGSIGIGGFGMNGIGMNSLDGSMGMMGMGVPNGGLSLGSLNPLQSPSLQTPSLSTNNNSVLPTSHPSPPRPPLTSSIGSSPPQSATTITANHQDKQSILANEKRRRRRESHNAVERRRRDNINEKISELATLIPECMLEGSGSSGVGNGNGGSSPSHLTPTSPAGGLGLLDSSDPLLPSSYGLTNANGNGSGSPLGIKEEVGEGEGGGAVVKANKGMILRKSVDYIRYLQQLVTAQGARNRELEQELKAYRGSSDSGGVDGIAGGNSNDGESGFGNYGGGEGRGRLPSTPEDDDEDEFDNDHQHHHHHHQQQQHHQQHHQREDMEVDINMNMDTMNGGHFNGMDSNAIAENLRGRTRVVRCLSSGGLAAGDKNTNTGVGGALKEEIGDDDDVLGVVGGFGIGIGRTAREM